MTFLRQIVSNKFRDDIRKQRNILYFNKLIHISDKTGTNIWEPSIYNYKIKAKF